MRPEVRAEYERRAADRRRRPVRRAVERFFTELRDPLFALYGDDARFPRGGRAAGAIARTAARAPGGAARASTTSARSRPTGSSASRPSATSPTSTASPARCRASRAAPLPARARRHLPAPDAAAARAARAQRRRLRGRRLRRGRARARDDGRPARARRRPARRGMALCIDLVLNHTAREHPWAQAAIAGDARMLRLLPHVPRPHRAGRLRADAARGLPRHRAGQLHLGPGARPLGVDDVQRLPVGPRLHATPRSSSRWPRSCSASQPPASTCCASTRCRSCGSASGRTARTSPRSTSCCRRCAPSMRIAAPGGRVQGRGDRRPARPRRLPRRRRHEGKECDLAYHNVLMVLLWSALASRRVALLTHTLRGDAARAAGRRVGDLRALPRRHRLGDHRGGRGRRRRGRLPAPPLPRRLLRRRLPRLVRPRRALPGQPAHRRRAHERHGGLAVRARAGARERRRGRRRPRRPPDAAALRVAFAYGGMPLVYMGDELGLRNDPRWADDPAHARRQPLDAPAADGLGGGRAPRRPGDRRGPAVGRPAAARRRSPRDPRRPRPGAGEPFWTGNEHVFGLLRTHAGDRLLLLANFTPVAQPVHLGVLHGRGAHLDPAAKCQSLSEYNC